MPILEDREENPAQDNVLVVMTHTIHLSIDIGMKNLGIFCVLVTWDTWEWVRVILLATFDICDGVETGGKECTSLIASNAVALMNSLTVIKPVTRLFIEEQFIATGKGSVFMQNNDARRLEAIFLGYFITKKEAWKKYRIINGEEQDLVIYRVPNKIKLLRCPKQLRKNKPAYKEWTRQQAIIDLREKFDEAASVIDCADKGDDAGDAVMQYIEASKRIKEDSTKYLW